jgi:hypothetical protein
MQAMLDTSQQTLGFLWGLVTWHSNCPLGREGERHYAVFPVYSKDQDPVIGVSISQSWFF